MNARQTTTLPLWHADLWQHMARAMASDRVAHGLLICGPAGVGKRVFAERIVRALLCRQRRDDADACGQCSACRQYVAGTHPDISRLMPEEPGRLIKVEQVRAFGQRLQLTPQYDSGRIGWIDPAERLSASAANSLLKTLEEPPAGCHIVLLADRVSALMATIRSRSQLWRVPPPDPDTARAWLADNGADSDKLDADSLRAPFAVLERSGRDYATLARGWDEDLAALLRAREDASTIAERMAGHPADLWLAWLYRRAGALLSAALGGADDTSLPTTLRQAGAHVDAGTFASWCAGVGETARLAHTNAEWQLVIESLLLNLQQSLQPK